MNLEFEKKDNWEAEFEATADFNLHIEGVPEGQVRIYQRGTSDGEYAYVREATPYPSFADVYDFDFSALVYPKWIKVVCGNKPTSAQIVTDGDVQQMKFQDKTVEIASNGTTVVTPDDGFTALGKVNVKVNVPTSGEGGGTASGSTVEYFDMSEVDYDIKRALISFSLFVKVPQEMNIEINKGTGVLMLGIPAGAYPSGTINVNLGRIEEHDKADGSFSRTLLQGVTAMGFDLSKTIPIEGQLMPLNEVLALLGIKDYMDTLRITEEEFYNLDA